MKNEIRTLTLYFPHGATVDSCQKVAQLAQKYVGANVSSGGFTPTNIHCDSFAKDMMMFEYGYKFEPKPSATEKEGGGE